MKLWTVVIAIAAVSCTHTEMYLDVPSGGTLEDAVLMAGPEGGPPSEVRALGDIDLTRVRITFSFGTAAADATHWWLIGQRADEVVFTSGIGLAGKDLHSVEPYDVAGAADWDIPENLEAYVEEGTWSADWWAQTVNHHAGHAVPDGDPARLWQFGPAATEIGTITIRLDVPN